MTHQNGKFSFEQARNSQPIVSRLWLLVENKIMEIPLLTRSLGHFITFVYTIYLDITLFFFICNKEGEEQRIYHILLQPDSSHKLKFSFVPINNNER